MSFDVEAPLFDLFSSRSYAWEAEDLVKRFPKAKTVLEVGGGTGGLTAELVKLGLEVTVIEPSSAMLAQFKVPPDKVTIFQGTVQDFKTADLFDLGIAHYDVLNFISFADIDEAVSKMQSLCYETSIEIWDPKQGVSPIRYRKVGDIRRLRFAFKFRRQVYLWFLFFGRGTRWWPVLSHHHLYLHEYNGIPDTE